ncbi:MAG: AsnC family transcriptional regulator [Candidatus Bathyarchaeota archaeon]|nr:AsnC family transcriptional regulator [Candidatus Bathyarchaeota archaeon]MDH5746864.1 AsnC family transcriptional regulator [Candidatus Bathyarchaeota archaeon]
MRNKLDLVDIRILEGLAKYGPRNMKRLAKELNMPRGTVLSRIKHLSSSSYFYLRLLTNVYHTNLGMKKAVVFARATPGQEALLFNCMKVNKFYIYLSRCFGMFEGCVAVYIVPKEHTTEFEHFLLELRKSRVAQEIKMLWSTCFHTVNLTRKWFDSSCETWIFPWDRWLEEIPSGEIELPYTLKDPESFTLKADETDLFIVKELEKDATISLTAIARKFGTTLQNICYHYENHVIKHGLIETFQIGILPFERTTSDLLLFVFRFNGEEKMAKFAQSLLDKPFVSTVGKVLGENAIVCQVYLPRLEFRKFIDALSKLARAGFLQSYDYVLQDLRPGKWSRETVPYELFRNGSWVYDHGEHIRSLHDLVNKLA